MQMIKWVNLKEKKCAQINITRWLTIRWNQQLVNINTVLKLFWLLPYGRSSTRIEKENSSISSPNDTPGMLGKKIDVSVEWFEN